MKDRHQADVDPGEFQVLELLREVYRWRWLILAATLAAGLLAAGVSYTKPDIYESSAALIIREPQSALEQAPEATAPVENAPVLSVETLQLLTESTETLWELFESLWAKQSLEMWKGQTLDKEAAFRGFQGALSTEVRRQQTRRTGTSIELLPILVLRARAQVPADAQIIANEWAQLVETKSKEIYTQGVTALDDFIGDMYKQSNESLIRLEDELAKKTVEASVTLKTAQLTGLGLKLTEVEGLVLDLDMEIAVNAIAISEGKRRILEQEHEGEWIGTAAESASIKGEEYPFPVETLSSRAQRVLGLVEQKVKQMAELREYRLAQNYLAKEKKFTHYQTDLERILLEKAKAEDELPAVEETLAALTKELETIPETLVLNKAITDDALWEAALNNPDADVEKLGSLKSEVLNSVYQTTKERIVETKSRVDMLRSSVAQLTKSADSVSSLMENLEREIAEAKQEVDRREAALKDTETSITLLREDYLAEIKRVEEFESASLRKIEEKKTREERLAAFQDQARSLEEELSLSKLDLDMLGREVEKTKNVRNAIASKAETAALLQVTAENASRTGTTILYSAQADPTSLAFRGSKVVLATMLTTFLLASVLLMVAKVLRPEPPAGARARR
jgi:hypothetical protein